MVSSGYFSLLYSVRKKPLQYWRKQNSQTGRVRKTLDLDLLENVVELQDLSRSNNSNTFITRPAALTQLLDLRLPVLVIIIKNMNVECRFQVQIVDVDRNRRYFHFSNEPLKSDTSVRSSAISRVQVKLTPGWNRVEIDFEDLTHKAFRSRYEATQRLAICANCRLRRVYFVDRHYEDMEISPELCKAFFDCYMIKRGIYPTQKSETTCRKAKNNSQFLRNLRIKSGKLINDFFTRTKTNVDNVPDFENKMRSMFLDIPRLGDPGIFANYRDPNASSESSRCKTSTKDENEFAEKKKYCETVYLRTPRIPEVEDSKILPTQAIVEKEKPASSIKTATKSQKESQKRGELRGLPLRETPLIPR